MEADLAQFLGSSKAVGFEGLRTHPYPAEPGFLPCVDSRQGRVTGSECEH